jgi:uncharacterized protein YmfQ (DUF2313 family)
MGEALAHMHSLAARPRILRALPSQLTPARVADRAVLAAVQSCIASHQLLTDVSDAATSQALDEYLAHIERLAAPIKGSGGSTPTQAAAAVLLGQAARECGPRRFVTSFAKWATLLVTIVKPDKFSHSTAAAIAAAKAVTDVLVRAGAMMDVPGVRKEAATVVQRAVPPVLAWLEEHVAASASGAGDDASSDETTAVVALALVRGALEGHPASVRPRADSVEAALTRVVYSRAVSPGVCTEVGSCVRVASSCDP